MEIKEKFEKNVEMVEMILEKYKKELKRTNGYCSYRNTRKSKLNAYRKIINDELLFIENNYGGGVYDYEKE